MTKPQWEQLDGEPDVWYERFHAYLLMGPGRSIDGAYAKHRQDEGKPTATRSQRKATGSWSRAATAFRWAERARAYDNDERRRLRERRFQETLRVQTAHEGMFSHAFVKVANRLRTIDPSDLSFEQCVSLLIKIANMERTIRGTPLDLLGRDGRDDDASPESASFTVDTDARSPLSNADLAEVTAILIQHGAIHAEPEPDGEPSGSESAA